MTHATANDICTYEDICTFCAEASGSEENLFYREGLAVGKDYILYESPSFVVVPCIGALTDWYVLIVSRRHVLSCGWLEPSELEELQGVVADVTSGMTATAGQNVVLFEHGSFSFRDKGGACHDHAHIHVVATDRHVDDFVKLVSGNVSLEPCENWIREATRFVRTEGRSYLALSFAGGSLVGSAHNAPSQFFRRSLAEWLEAEEGEWDWATFPQHDRLRKMIENGLAGKHPLMASDFAL